MVKHIKESKTTGLNHKQILEILLVVRRFCLYRKQDVLELRRGYRQLDQHKISEQQLLPDPTDRWQQEHINQIDWTDDT